MARSNKPSVGNVLVIPLEGGRHTAGYVAGYKHHVMVLYFWDRVWDGIPEPGEVARLPANLLKLVAMTTDCEALSGNWATIDHVLPADRAPCLSEPAVFGSVAVGESFATKWVLDLVTMEETESVCTIREGYRLDPHAVHIGGPWRAI